MVRDLLAASGFAASVIPTAGWPVVYGERIEDPSLPTLLVYILLGRYFISGLMSGSVK